jgi:hypothetical protein
MLLRYYEMHIKESMEITWLNIKKNIANVILTNCVMIKELRKMVTFRDKINFKWK